MFKSAMRRSACGSLGFQALILGFGASAAAAQTGPFVAPTGPFLLNNLPGVQPVGSTQLRVDTDADGFPDHLYDLPPEIRPGTGFSLQYRLSPTQEVLYTRKFSNSSAPLGGCTSASQYRIYFHRLDPPPGTGMTAFTGDQGQCFQGPINQGPLFRDNSTSDPVRTAMVISAPYPAGTPTNQAILWADLVCGQVNVDTSTYDYGVLLPLFSPAGHAAFIRTANSLSSQRRYYLVDLCESPIAATNAVAQSLTLSGNVTAEVTTNGSNLFATIRLNGGSPPLANIPLENCLSPHACCLPSDQCALLLPSDCRCQGGTALAATDCAGVNCAGPVGACCDVEGFCTVTPAGQCAGTYLGDGTTCPDPACDPPPPVTLACCIPTTGECADVTADQCADLGGNPGAAGSACASASCPPPPGTQACCTPQFGCGNLPVSNCINFFQGIPQGEGTNCLSGDVSCPTAVLSIGKNAPEIVQEGNTFDYLIGYGNLGPSQANNVEIMETLPTGATLINAGDAPGGVAPTIAGGVITWPIGSLPAGTVDQYITVTVRAGCNVSGDRIVNSAYRMSGSPGGIVLGSQVVTHLTPAGGGPVNIAVASTDLNGDPLQTGDLLEHAITLTNTVAETQAGIQVGGQFGAATTGGLSTFDSVVDAAGGTFTVQSDARSFSWQGNLPASGQAVLVFRTIIDDCPPTHLSQEILNHGAPMAVRSACGTELGTTTPMDVFHFVRPIRSEIVALGLGPAQTTALFGGVATQAPKAGSTIEFEARLVEQLGGDRPSVTASVTLPPGIQPEPPNNPLISPPAGATYDPNTRTITYSGPVGAGQTVAVRFGATVADGNDCNSLRQFLPITGSVGDCANIKSGLTILIIPDLPTGPYIVGADRFQAMWMFEPGVDATFRPLLCHIGEIYIGMGRGPDGDMWFVDDVQLVRLNPEVDPPTFEILREDFMDGPLNMQTVHDAAIDPTDATVIFVGTNGTARRYDPVIQQVTTVIEDPALGTIRRASFDPEGQLAVLSNLGLQRLDLNKPLPLVQGDYAQFDLTIGTDLGGVPGARQDPQPINLAVDSDGDYLVTVQTLFIEDYGDPFSAPLRYTAVYSLVKVDRTSGSVGTPVGTPTLIVERLAGFSQCLGSCPTPPPDFSDAMFFGADLISAGGIAVGNAEEIYIGRDNLLDLLYRIDRSTAPSGSILGSGGPGYTAVDIVYVDPGLPGDFDGDGDVDSMDVDFLNNCALGPEIAQTDPLCEPADLDGDGDVDQSDYGLLQVLITQLP